MPEGGEAGKPAWTRAAPWFAFAAVLVVLDQWSKAAVLARLALGERIELTAFFNLVLAFNSGAAFSFLADAGGWQKLFLTVLAVIAVVVVSVLLLRNAHQPRFCAGLTLILSGALGNLIDRLRLGHVVDFLDFHAMGWHWPAFNVADSAISIGAVILILDSFLHRDAKEAGRA